MVEKFDIDKHARLEPQKKDLYEVSFVDETVFIVVKNVDFLSSRYLTLTGRWESGDGQEEQIIVPYTNIRFIKNLLYRPR